jgi:hypothetical protein
MRFSDKRQIQVAGKVYTLRQRSLHDVLASTKAHIKYGRDNEIGAAYVLAASVADGLKHDNYRTRLPFFRKWWKIDTSWVLKRFSLTQLQYIHSELQKLETYEVKKKDTDEVAGL